MCNKEESLSIPDTKYEGSDIDNIKVDSGHKEITIYLKDKSCFFVRPKLSVSYSTIEAVLDIKKGFWGKIK